MLTSAVTLPLMAALVLPTSFGVLICRSGAIMPADGCCSGLAHPERVEDAGRTIDTEPCCSVRAVDLGTPLAEQSGRVEANRDHVLATDWTIAAPEGLARPDSAAPRPVVRPIGPPVRLLKQSFLL